MGDEVLLKKERIVSKQLKLYVGCALTEAPPEFRDKVTELKAALRAIWNPDTQGPKYEVFEFLGLTAGTPRDVFQKDINENVAKCDLLLIVGDYASWGAAIELTVGTMIHQKPVLFVKPGTKLTRIIPGMAEFFPNLKYEFYEDMLRDVPKLLNTFVDNIYEDMLDSVGVPHATGHGHAVGLDDDPV
jgi:hypothetical protein